MLGEKLCKYYENEHPPALKPGLDAHMEYGTDIVPTKGTITINTKRQPNLKGQASHYIKSKTNLQLSVFLPSQLVTITVKQPILILCPYPIIKK